MSYFGVPILPDMQGHDLEKTLLDDTPVRQYALFGMFGAQVNITDGRYVYMRSPVDGNAPLYNYTLMPTHMRQMFSVEEMRSATMFTGFSFTKGVPVMRIKSQEDTSGILQSNLKKVQNSLIWSGTRCSACLFKMLK